MEQNCSDMNERKCNTRKRSGSETLGALIKYPCHHHYKRLTLGSCTSAVTIDTSPPTIQRNYCGIAELRIWCHDQLTADTPS